MAHATAVHPKMNAIAAIRLNMVVYAPTLSAANPNLPCPVGIVKYFSLQSVDACPAALSCFILVFNSYVEPICNPFVFTFMHRMGVYHLGASFLCVPLPTLRLCVILFSSSASAILFAVGSLQSAPHPEIRGAPCSRCA